MKYFLWIVFGLFALMVIGWKSLLFWCVLGFIIGYIILYIRILRYPNYQPHKKRNKSNYMNNEDLGYCNRADNIKGFNKWR